MRFSVAGYTTYPMSALTKYRAVLCMKVTGALRALSSTGIMSMVGFRLHMITVYSNPIIIKILIVSEFLSSLRAKTIKWVAINSMLPKPERKPTLGKKLRSFFN
jgi:hypothetical protein